MIQIDHFSDVLCVWAYVAQARIDELLEQFPGKVSIRWHYLPVFGDVPGKIENQWAERGGVTAYAGHVGEVAADFDHVELNPATWADTVPNSSAQAHLWLCAARRAAAAGDLPEDAEPTLAWAVRLAFFRDARDIGLSATLREVVDESSIDAAPILVRLDDGTAHAALCDDMQRARDANVRSSPTLLFNDDRQRLTGNVGYRIIEANIRELLERPQSQHSWC